ncbi:YrzE family protein [Arthrobacter sp. NPDC058130]|uniref:YrzE family protein n=1 Tax=Arthrobacter sp. NPDC058130 TaxID=3346353 RepID=UPI0036E70CA8
MSSTTGPDDTTPRHAAPQDNTEQDKTTPAKTTQVSTAQNSLARDKTAPESTTVPVTAVRHDTAVHDTAVDTGVDEVPTRQTVVAREKEQFGGIQVGSAFFGWLAATGMAVLLTALVAAGGTAVGLATNTDVNEAVNQASSNQTIGLAGIIVLLAILLVSYYCGGYVAGRMARFNGARQGFMVWIWALIAAIVVAVLGLVAGQRFNILANLNSFPRIPVNEGQLNTMSIIAAVVVAGVALAGAVLGGLAGMRFHRRVDKAGFSPATVEDHPEDSPVGGSAVRHP